MNSLRLLCVHAHPDDESSKGAQTVARYAAEGVESTLVCCTGGEEGEVLNPAMDTPDVRTRMPTIRLEELQAAVQIIGYQHVELLGFRDSGMPDTEPNDRPDVFANVPDDEAVGRLVTIIRKRRPHVLVTYSDDQAFYPHPDHLRVHDISVKAFDAAADPEQFPGSGEPWQVSKLYYSVFSARHFHKMFQAFKDLELDWPFPEDRLDHYPDSDDRITTVLDVRDFLPIRVAALKAHATQIDPDSPFWFGLPPDLDADINGTEEYVLARSNVETSLPENDLFAGLREGQS